MFVKVVAPLLAVCLTVVSSRSDGLVGAPTDSDMNSPEVQNALRFAVDQYNANSDGIYISQVVKVIRVQTQVVAGMKYIFTIEMATTDCEKSAPMSSCALNCDPAIAQPHECSLAVWSQPWENSMILIENTC